MEEPGEKNNKKSPCFSFTPEFGITSKEDGTWRLMELNGETWRKNNKKSP